MTKGLSSAPHWAPHTFCFSSELLLELQALYSNRHFPTQKIPACTMAASCERDSSSWEQWLWRGPRGTDLQLWYLLSDGGLEPDPELSTSRRLKRRLPPGAGAPETLSEGEVELPYPQCCHQPSQRLREQPVVRDCGQH